ncbi:MAG TPA: chemotaxis protein CheA [Dissulfurispiraceae bacterium]|nr:chemotaxis protein CheA [Dissulfurispiraceae bacterium]
MSGDMDNHKAAYTEEAYELLAELESALLELEEQPDDQASIGRVFRAMHTIKGSGSMFGFAKIAAFTHEVETVFDRVRNGEIHVTKKLIDLTLEARDHIMAMLDENDTIDQQSNDRLIASFRDFLPSKSQPTAEDAAEVPDQPSGEDVTYRIRFVPPRDIYSKGINPLMLLDEIRELGKCRIVAQTDSVPLLEGFDPESCYLRWDIVLTTDKGLDAIKDIFIFIEDDSEIKIEVICGGSELHEDSCQRKLGEILIERGDVKREDLQELLKTQKRIGEILVDSGLVTTDMVQAALAEQEHIKDIQEKKLKEDTVASIRVPSIKLDKLVDLVGELVTVQARLSQSVGCSGNSILLSIAEEVERLTAELRDNTMNIRMLPIGTTFSKFKRLVRDLSRNLGKDVDLVTEGADTELDKNVIEKLADPLVHMIRNSIDHGIEPPEIREAHGKSRKGIVHLLAGHAGANVIIRIRDDGAGLDREAIRRKAIEKELIAADAEMTDKEIFALIMEPGFSTAKSISSVSGRGVGMDVVKQAISALRGTIEIDSDTGIGTTLTLKLPLTLAIIDGLLVRIADDFFVLPLHFVRECVEFSETEGRRGRNAQLINVRGQLIPYINLRNRFGLEGTLPSLQQAVITETDSLRIGFIVDSVIGQHQTVIKSLGTMYRNIQGVSGATILGDGSVALIIDVIKMILSEEAIETAATSCGQQFCSI